jgi:hypothetical protein
MLIRSNKQRYKRVYGRGALGNFLSDAAGQFFGSTNLKDLAKTIGQRGITYARPILNAAYEQGKTSLKELAHDTGKKIAENLVTSGEAMARNVVNDLKNNATQFVTDAKVAKNKNDLKVAVQNAGTKVVKDGTKYAKTATTQVISDIRNPVLQGITSLPTRVIDPTISAAKTAKSEQPPISVSNLISGYGSRMPKKRKNKGDGLYNFGTAGNGLYRFGTAPQTGTGLIRL